MNDLDLQPATEETVVRLVRATRANDADAATTRHSQQTDRCPSVARFSAVLRCGGSWSTDEQAHIRDCRFCQRVRDMFVTAIPASADDPTLKGDEGTLGGARVASGEDTIVEGSRRPSSQPVAGPGDGEDTVTESTNKKKRG